MQLLWLVKGGQPEFQASNKERAENVVMVQHVQHTSQFAVGCNAKFSWEAYVGVVLVYVEWRFYLYMSVDYVSVSLGER